MVIHIFRGKLEVNLFQKMSAPGPAWARYTPMSEGFVQVVIQLDVLTQLAIY